MELKKAIQPIKKKFQTQIDLQIWDDPILSFKHVFKAEYQNSYVAIRENVGDHHLEVTFFKSDKKHDRLFDDYIDFGIVFYPKTIENLRSILDSIDA